MAAAFTYGLRAGASTPLLVVTDTAAVLTDLLLFFVPAYFFSDRLRTLLSPKLQERYVRATQTITRVGAFRAAIAMAFIPPSVIAMTIVGLLHLSFWRTMAGLFVGSSAYVVVPLVLALPLAAALPSFLLPVLPWTAPALAVLIVLIFLIRAWWNRTVVEP